MSQKILNRLFSPFIYIDLFTDTLTLLFGIEKKIKILACFTACYYFMLFIDCNIKNLIKTMY